MALSHTPSFTAVIAKRIQPVPIPNTEVKLFSADGTARATVWESRSSPYFLLKAPIEIYLDWGFLCLMKSENRNLKGSLLYCIQVVSILEQGDHTKAY